MERYSFYLKLNLKKLFLECQCDERGSASQVCDKVDGSCGPCVNETITGHLCNECIDGYWDFDNLPCKGMKLVNNNGIFHAG